MLRSAIVNYIKYFRKFFKCFFIISFSIILFYIVFSLSIYLPIKNNDLEIYNSFIEDMEFYISNISGADFFTSDFLSRTSKDLLEIMSDIDVNLTAGTILIVISAVIVLGAFLFSKYDCKRTIRNDVKNKDTAMVLTQNIFKLLINVVFWGLFFILTYYWFYAIFVLPFVLLVFDAFKILIYTWYVYFRKYSIKQFLTLKSSLNLVVTNVVILYLHSMLFIFLSSYLTVYMLLLLALSFYAYTTTVTEFTATKYFIKKRQQRDLSIT